MPSESESGIAQCHPFIELPFTLLFTTSATTAIAASGVFAYETIDLYFYSALAEILP
jgi:hypothetical protein